MGINNSLICVVFKVKHIIADFSSVFSTESENHAHFTQSGQVFEI